MAWLNRVLELQFASPACDETKAEMKANGWRFEFRRNAWVHEFTPEAEAFAAELIERDREREAAFREQTRAEIARRHAAAVKTK